jgi:hypothetical protein
MAARIPSFISFHGAILKHGVGHRLSDGKRFPKYFLCSRAPVGRVRSMLHGD